MEMDAVGRAAEIGRLLKASRATSGGLTYQQQPQRQASVLPDDDADVLAWIQQVHNSVRQPNRVRAERLTIADLLDEEHDPEKPVYYAGCDAGDILGGECVCGLDWRRARTLRILALGWSEQPGYRTDWAL